MVTDRKKLVIDSYRDRRAASAHCALCGTSFRSGPDLKADEAARHIYSEFDSHECKKHDVDQGDAETGRAAIKQV